MRPMGYPRPMDRSWLLAIVLASLGCSGGGGPSYSITTGVYVVSNQVTTVNSCNFQISNMDGQAITVTVSGDHVSIPALIQGASFVIDGSKFSRTFDRIDVDNANGCSEHVHGVQTGTMTSETAFAYDDHYTITVSNGGGGCLYVACESDWKMKAEK